MSNQNVLMDEALQVEANSLLEMPEDNLNQLLGMRVQAINEDLSLSLQPTFDVERSPFESITLPPWIQKTVDSMIITALRQSHNVLCSNEKEFEDIRNKLVAALGLGGSTAVIALAAFLTGTLGLAAALATVLATIVIKKIGQPALIAGHKTMCAELGNMLA